MGLLEDPSFKALIVLLSIPLIAIVVLRILNGPYRSNRDRQAKAEEMLREELSEMGLSKKEIDALPWKKARKIRDDGSLGSHGAAGHRTSSSPGQRLPSLTDVEARPARRARYQTARYDGLIYSTEPVLFFN